MPVVLGRGLSCPLQSAVACPLLGGSRSAGNLTVSLEGQSNVFADARKVVWPGVGHPTAGNDGQLGWVAAELRHVFR